jgi:hypothetical protein
MEIASENCQEGQFEHSDADERNRHIIPLIEEDQSPASDNALMLRPIAGPLQVLTNR